MGRTHAAFVVAASLLAVASSEASAWVCFATGLGSGGYGRSYDVIDAKLFALRSLEWGVRPASRAAVQHRLARIQRKMEQRATAGAQRLLTDALNS